MIVVLITFGTSVVLELDYKSQSVDATDTNIHGFSRSFYVEKYHTNIHSIRTIGCHFERQQWRVFMCMLE